MYKVKKHLDIDDNNYKSLSTLLSFMSEKGKSVYLVGGCVRDLLLGKTPKDIDLCTDAKPEEIINIFSDIERYHLIATGLKHGTVTIHDTACNTFYEITTYRVDGEYTDGRHPDAVTFVPSLEEDLKRRDFTINSFAYDLSTEEILMLDESFLKDLNYGIIRTVGKATDRFSEDALRMLRAIRFSAQLNFSISEEAYNGIKELADSIKKVSKERIRDELTKILLSDHPEMLELIALSGLEVGMFDGLIPLENMLKCPHDNPWHYTDVFHHTVDVIKKVPATFTLRWAALFHDIGKPTVKKLKEGTENHYVFYGHPDISADIAKQIMGILKFSNNDADLIYKFVKYHDYPAAECSTRKFKELLVIIGIDNFPDFIKLRYADTYSHALIMGTKFAITYIDELIKRFDRIAMVEKQPLTLKDLKVNGNDVKNVTGKEGPEVGKTLNWLLEVVLDNPKENTRERLLQLLRDGGK